MRKLFFSLLVCGVFALGIFGLAKISLADWGDITGAITNNDAEYNDDSYIYSLYQASDGSIYAGGYYDDGTNYHYVWKYENGNWTDVTGSINGSVSAFAELSDGTLIAEGAWTTVWQYSGGVWADISGNLTGGVYSLLKNSDGAVYAGTSTGMWQYNGASSWTDISSTFADLNVHNMIAGVDGCVYADGIEGSNTYCSVWKYCSGAWTDFSRGLVSTRARGVVQTLDGTIYFAGYFDGKARVWKYDGSWSDVTGDLNLTSIRSMLKVNDNLILTAGSSGNYAGVWRYSSGIWADVTGVMDGARVSTLMQASDATVYAGGYKAKTGTGAGDYARVWAYNDVIPPTTSISPAAGKYKTSQTVTLGVVDDLSGVDKTYYTTNGKKPKTKKKFEYKEPFSVDSNQVVKFFSVDNKGNREKVKKAKFNIKKAVWRMNNVTKKKKLKANNAVFRFAKLKKKLKKHKYYFKVKQYKKYGPGSNKSKAVKRYWKILTNLKSKKGYKVRMTFKYKHRLIRGLRESSLKLMYRANGGWNNANAKLKTKKNKLIKSWTRFPGKKMYFTIGVK